jgi:hypothetical protein
MRLLKGLAAAAAVLGFLIDPLVGGFLSLYGQKMAVKRQVARHIVRPSADDGIVLLTFTQEETRTLLRWEHPREFEYDGQMYDIIETTERGDKVTYRCWWDRAETRLNERLRALAARAFREIPKLGGERAPLPPDLHAFCRTDAGGWSAVRPGLAPEGPVALIGFYASAVLFPASPPPWAA